MKNNKIYFLGIGGIGMSAIAQYYLQIGYEVYGYDLTPSPVTEILLEKGAKIHFQDDISQIPYDVNFVVYTPAVPKDLSEYQYFIDNNVPFFKRSQVLGMITDDYYTVAVAGTHGKTTTTSMLAHLFNVSNIDDQLFDNRLLAFIGGISKNLNDNFFYDGNKYSANTIAVVEADEFDRSFLTLHPNVSVITSMDADHLDVYSDRQHLIEAFQEFANQSDTVFCEKGISEYVLKDSTKKFVYGTSSECDCYPFNIKQTTFGTTFDLHTPFFDILDIEIPIFGIYNVLNATAAISAFIYTKLQSKGHLNDAKLQLNIKAKMREFIGVKRRFDIVVRRDDFIYIDDYAHHPKEMSSFFTAVRELFPKKRICAVFQPHLYSRTRDFAIEFAKSLDIVDEVILLPIYPARELPIEGVNSEMILSKMKISNKRVLDKNQLFDYLKEHRPEILLTVGAGDIDRLVPQLKSL